MKFRYADDAAEAKQRMNHKVIGGREIRIVFAEENRKTPQEMRTTARVRCDNHFFGFPFPLLHFFCLNIFFIEMELSLHQLVDFL